MENNKEISLIFQLDYLPSGAHYNNLRYLFNQKVWQVIVANVRECKQYTCEFCKRKFDYNNANSLKYLHCHELWSFDYAKSWQVLKGLLLLCNNCHSCQHINFATLQNRFEKTKQHFLKVNRITNTEFNYLKNNELLFRKNYLDKQTITREMLDSVESCLFKIDCDLNQVFVNKTNAQKLQEFLERISSFNS